MSLMRDPSAVFPPVDEPESVTALRVWFCRYQTLAPLSGLTNLRVLVVAGYPDRDLGPIAALRQLE